MEPADRSHPYGFHKKYLRGETTIHTPGGGCCSLRACNCALPLRPFMRGQSGG